MNVWLVVLWWYLALGVVNYTVFAAQGKSLLFSAPNRGVIDGLVEAVFYVLGWFFQLLFWLLVGLHNATGWMLERTMGGH